MLVRLLMACLLGASLGSASTLGGWIRQSLPLNSYNITLNDVHFVDANSGYLVGSGSTILKTMDGGASWDLADKGVKGGGFTSVVFTDANTGWVLEQFGSLYKTTDGGANWAQVLTGRGPGSDIRFTDAKTGFITGQGGTRKTEDGGRTWSLQSNPVSFRSQSFFDSDTGWMAGAGGQIVKTVDGGASWVPQPTGTVAALNSIHFIDARLGWAAGDSGAFLKTTDGGAHWNLTFQASGNRLSQVHFTDADQGWILGGGRIWNTTDGGRTWSARDNDSTNNLHSIAFADARHGWVVGAAGTLLQSSDGGATWKIRSPIGDVRAIHFSDTSTGLGITFKRILKTADGGRSWTIKLMEPDEFGFGASHFPDPTHGWVGGGAGFFHTSDAGETWVAQSAWAAGGPIISVHFIDSKTGFAVALYLPCIGRSCGIPPGFTVIGTSDGGKVWTALWRGTNYRFTSIHFLDAQTGWLAGAEGVLFKTTDGGKNWLPQASGTRSQLNRIHFTDSRTGFVLGNRILLRTVDGGSTWNSQEYHVALNSISFADAANGWIAGEQGTLLKTSDGGLTWRAQESGTASNLHSLSFLDASTGFAAGFGPSPFGPILLKTTDGGGKLVGFLPPRNPRIGVLTFSHGKLRYRLERPSRIRAILYGGDGRTIGILIDGMRGPGYHALEVNPGNPFSGIHYLDFQADGIRQSLKLSRP